MAVVLITGWRYAGCSTVSPWLSLCRIISVSLVAVWNCQETVADCISILLGENTFSHILCYTFVCELF